MVIFRHLSVTWCDAVAFHFINRWTTPPPPPEGWPDTPYDGWWLHIYRLVLHWQPYLRRLGDGSERHVKRHTTSAGNRIVW